MAEKCFKGAPFGTQTPRFNVSSVHPQSKTPGTFTQVPYCKKSTSDLAKKLGPGIYNVDVGGFNTKSVSERAHGPGWRQSFDTAKLARMPHLLYKEQWQRKKEQARCLGPGKYEYDTFIDICTKKQSSTRGHCDTRDMRFRVNLTTDVPGPGTYGKGGIPAACLEETNKKAASNIGILSSGSSGDRSYPIVGCKLAPGRYNYKAFTEDILNKVVSKRGPYDLFSGERDSFAKQKNKLGPGEYDLPSFSDDWNTIHKRKHGKFGNVPREGVSTERIYCSTLSQCPRKTLEPGPTKYTPNVIPRSKTQPPFLSTAERFDKRTEKYFRSSSNPVGTGRYDLLRWNMAQHGYGSNHVFTSSSKRFESADRENFLKERIRRKDVPVTRTQ